jgi:hypothetical protein
MSDDIDHGKENKYEGLRSVASTFALLTVLSFILGFLFIFAALVVPTWYADEIKHFGLPSIIFVAILLAIGAGLLITSWNFKVGEDQVRWRIDMAEYARRTAEAVEALAASVKRK